MGSAPSGLRPAALLLAIVCVFAGASYAINRAQQTGSNHGDDHGGRSASHASGRTHLPLLFDPECSHCFEAAKQMSGYTWKDVKVITVPTRVKQFAGQFLTDTGLKAPVTLDDEALRVKFKFTDPPYGVMLRTAGKSTRYPVRRQRAPRDTEGPRLHRVASGAMALRCTTPQETR